MSRRFLVQAGDRLDRIARTLYGNEGNGAVEALLDANPGLSAHGGFAPEGYMLTVPDRLTSTAAAATRPWE